MCNQPLRSCAPPLPPLLHARLARVLLYCLLFSFSTVVPAQIEQFSVAQCAQLDAALELNREQQRRGYQLKQELKIKAQQAQLELQLQYHCQQPQTIQPRRRGASTGQNTRPDKSKSTQSRRAEPVKNPARSSPAASLTISVISVKAPYQGAKQKAWLAYYQPPFYCFGVRHTERIRQCVEQRQQAQQRFEQQYSKGIAGHSQ